MNPAAARAGAALVALVLAASFACGPVVGAPLSEAPINACGNGEFSCDRYVVEGAAPNAQCRLDEGTQRSRCEYLRVEYPFSVVVHVPSSSHYAAGHSVVRTSESLTAQLGTKARCDGTPGTPQCIRLPLLVDIQGTYRVTKQAAATLGVPLEHLVSIPVNVVLVPIAPGSNVEAAALGLPIQDIVTSSRAVAPNVDLPDKKEIRYDDGVSVGRYLRIAYPQPPFDATFPPAFTTLAVTQPIIDQFILGVNADLAENPKAAPLDDEAGLTRTITVTRKEGLDGWSAWLMEPISRRRISTIKALAGVRHRVVLHTVGWNVPGAATALLKDATLVVSPPAGSLAMPRLELGIKNGAGLSDTSERDLPTLPAAATFTGVVAHGEGGPLTGVPSRLLFTSSRLPDPDGVSTFFTYVTTVSTDEAGRFATVLPVGIYTVTIEPAEGTGFATTKRTIDTTVMTSTTFDPPARSVAFGNIALADGRALSEAAVIASPSASLVKPDAIKPRPARTRTDGQGNFRFEVDQGQYDLVIDPQPGTGFPRVIQVHSFGTGPIDVGQIVIPPPARLAFVVRDTFGDLFNPIRHAVVRIYAELPGRGPPALEIGRGMTGVDGSVEILLAPQAH